MVVCHTVDKTLYWSILGLLWQIRLLTHPLDNRHKTLVIDTKQVSSFTKIMNGVLCVKWHFITCTVFVICFIFASFCQSILERGMGKTDMYIQPQVFNWSIILPYSFSCMGESNTLKRYIRLYPSSIGIQSILDDQYWGVFCELKAWTDLYHCDICAVRNVAP